MSQELAEFLNYMAHSHSRSACTVDSYRRDIERFLAYLEKIDKKFFEVDKNIALDYAQELKNGAFSKKALRYVAPSFTRGNNSVPRSALITSNSVFKTCS